MGQKPSEDAQNTPPDVAAISSGIANSFQSANLQATMSSVYGSLSNFSKTATHPSGSVGELEHAVRSMQPDHVKHILHSKVDVNAAIDADDHTVLDAFAVEHFSMLKNIINLRVSPEEKTRIFYSNQENARAVLEILTQAGAQLSTHVSSSEPKNF